MSVEHTAKNLPPEEAVDYLLQVIDKMRDRHSKELQVQKAKRKEFGQRAMEAEGHARSLEARLKRAEDQLARFERKPGRGEGTLVLDIEPTPVSIERLRRVGSTPKPVNKTCPVTGKRSFSSEAQAKRAQKGLRSGDRLRTYLCPHCGGWHWTSQFDH